MNVLVESMKAAENAEGTEFEKERAQECSATIMKARNNFTRSTKAELKTLLGKPKL